jgi:ATP-dependent DNA helicase RecQ
VSEKLGEPRDRIVRALDYLAEKGHIELVATGVQEQIVRLREPTNLPALVDELTARFEAIEGREVARVHEIAAFIEGEGCHTRRMVAYFGEELGRDCGHCTGCRERVALLPATPGELPDRTTLDRLRAEHPVLASARAAARFFCGVTSPALTKAKLTRHPAFGSAADVDFRDVMRWAS